MVISEFHFFQVKREPFFGDAVKFDNSFFGVTPESLNAVDVNFAVAKMLSMVNVNMSVTTEHQGVVAFKFIRVNDTTAPDHLDCQVQESFGFNVSDYLHMDTAISLEDTEYRNLIGSPAAAFTFALAPKVRFIDFNDSIHPIGSNGILPNSSADELDSLESCRITQSNLLSNTACRNFQFKELDDPQPLFGADFNFIQPSVTEVVEGISTPLTSIPFAQQPIDFITVTPAAKNMPFFPAEFSQIQPGTVLTFDDELKGF